MASIEITLTPQMKDQAAIHARQRSLKIKRRFVPDHAPLSAIESNFIGALGEIAIHYLMEGRVYLSENYNEAKADKGDILIKDLVFDIKTEAVPQKYYQRIIHGDISEYEPYGCRVWTATHLHHLPKYTGGIIFNVVPIPDNARFSKEAHLLRPPLFEYIDRLLVVGFVKPADILSRKPTLFSPPHPVTGRRFKYNSLNFLFRPAELRDIELLFRE